MIKITADTSLTTYKRLSSYLRAAAVRTLGDLARQGYTIPAAPELAEALADFAWTNHRDLINIQAPGEPKDTGIHSWAHLTEEELAKSALVAATRALASLSWRPGKLRERQSAGGTIGGRKGIADGVTKGPVPTKATPENIAMAVALRDIGKSQRQIAETLGMSVGMVNKLLASISGNRRTKRSLGTGDDILEHVGEKQAEPHR